MRMLGEFYSVNADEWVVAIRKRGNERLFEGNFDEFRLVPNSLKYWYADPFLFSKDGKDYLFVEMYDRKTQKGSIGVGRIRNGKCGKIKKIIDTPYHLSYPFIFSDDDGIHIVPECYSSCEVQMYKCIKFPYVWKKERLISNECAVDSTRITVNGTELWFATRFNSPNERFNDNLSVMSDSTGKLRLIKSGLLTRPAGHFVYASDGTLVRPSQNCTERYGGGLVFNKVTELTEQSYDEEPFLKVYAPNYAANGEKNIVCSKKSSWTYVGAHTYNHNDRYEVVDLKYSGGKSIYLFSVRFKRYLENKLFGK